jgi:tetratricopeptide (TPR) repeat protein
LTPEQEFDRRIAAIHGLHGERPDKPDGEASRMDIRHEELDALFDAFLGADFDPAKRHQVENLQVALHKQQAELARRHDQGEISDEQFLDATQRLIGQSFRECANILGEADFQSLFGAPAHEAAGLIDREAYLGNSSRGQAPAHTRQESPQEAIQIPPKPIPAPDHTEELLRFVESTLSTIDRSMEKYPDAAWDDLNVVEPGVDQVLSRCPDNTRAMVLKAKIYRRRWDCRKNDPQRRRFLERAVEVLTAAIQIDPTYGRAYYTRGSYHAVLGHTEEALLDLQQAIGLSAQDASLAKDVADLIAWQEYRQRMTADTQP